MPVNKVPSRYIPVPVGYSGGNYGFPIGQFQGQICSHKLHGLMTLEPVTDKDLLASLSINAGKHLSHSPRLSQPAARGPSLQSLGLVNPQHQLLEQAQSSALTPLGSLPTGLETLKPSPGCPPLSPVSAQRAVCIGTDVFPASVSTATSSADICIWRCSSFVF